jgi:hypothetical protein
LLAAFVHHAHMTNAGLDPVSLLAHIERLAAANTSGRPKTVKALVAALKTEIEELAQPAPIEILPAQPDALDFVAGASSLFLEEVSRHRTADSRVRGTVVRDRSDDDFGFVVSMRNPADGLFRCIDLQANIRSEEEATWALWTAMRDWAPHEAVAADFE